MALRGVKSFTRIGHHSMTYNKDNSFTLWTKRVKEASHLRTCLSEQNAGRPAETLLGAKYRIYMSAQSVLAVQFSDEAKLALSEYLGPLARSARRATYYFQTELVPVSPAVAVKRKVTANPALKFRKKTLTTSKVQAEFTSPLAGPV